MRFIILSAVILLSSGCASFLKGVQEAQERARVQEVAQQAAFQRDWDALTPEQRVQYRVAQQRLDFERQAAREKAFQEQLTPPRYVYPPPFIDSNPHTDSSWHSPTYTDCTAYTPNNVSCTTRN